MKTSFSEHVARFLVAWRWTLLIVGVVLSVCFFLPARSLDFDRSIENMFAPDDPLLPPYQRLKRAFGGNEIVLAVYTDPDLMSEDGRGIERLSELSSELKDMEGVHDVLSLAELDASIRKLKTLEKARDAVEDPFSAAKNLFGGLLGSGAKESPPPKPEPEGIVDPESQTARQFLDIFEGYTHGRDPETDEVVTAAVVCMLRPEAEADVSRQDTIDDLRDLVNPLRNGQIAGEPAMVVDGYRYIEQDAKRLGWASTLLMGLTIIICFRSLRWVLIAVGVVQIGLMATKAVLFWSNMQLSMVSSMLTAIVTVVGVATVVHVIVRFRGARAEGLSPRDSLVRTATLLAVPVFWACTTDAVGFASLMVARVGPVQDFGLMMATGCLMVLVSVALLAPGLSLAGWHPSGAVRRWGERLLDSGLASSLHRIERRPKIIVAVAAVVCIATAAGAYRLQVETDFTKNFRAGSPIVRAYKTVETELGGAGVWDVVVPAPETLEREYIKRVERLERRLRDEVTVTDEDGTKRPALQTLSLADVTSGPLSDLPLPLAIDSMQTSMPVFTAALLGKDPDSPKDYYYRIMLRADERQPAEQKRRLIDEVTRISREEFKEAEVTGSFVLLTNLIASVIRDQWLAFCVALAGIGVTMLLAFGRPVYAVIALVPNALPILMVTGLMGWIGLKINMGAAMIAAVSVGLSVDSSIHYISFFRRARAAGKTVRDALTEVQQSVGRAMIFSTLALIVGFSVLCISEFVPTIYFGSLVALSMLGGLAGNLIILPLLLRLVSRD
ncbi:MAG: MMPL family transporter [Planctomycetes bacterium]|nr:MMPL family transporter [Planctomycetota bacterium]